MAQTIDRDSLKAKMDRGDDFRLVEVLAEGEWERLHIRGAENIPFGKVIEEAKKRFAKDEEIIVYCADPECKASPKAAQKLEAFGFSNVKEYPGGKKEWSAAGYPVEGREA